MKSQINDTIQKMRKMGFSNNQIAYIQEISRKIAQESEREATKKAFLYMLSIPLNVLVNDYWSKSAKKRAPKFIDDVISLYESVQAGVVTDKDLADLLFEYAGVEVKAEWLEREKKDGNN